MRKIYVFLVLLASASIVSAQTDSFQAKQLDEVIVTGQYKPQSLKSSVYQVKVINSQRIQASGATNVQQVLNTQLGFRFVTDNTLGTAEVKLMGMDGRGVKILLDGVPLFDRGETRESLNQIDINSIDRIEIVEGPMSISYGSDAMAGVINIITKKPVKDDFSVTARVQEETAGSEYYPFSFQGLHSQNLGLNWQRGAWNVSVGGSHVDFDGFGGDIYGRGKQWRPKEQWLGNIRVGYSGRSYSVYYRLDALDEDITDRDSINFRNYRAVDQQFITHRFMHQVQGDWRITPRWQLNGFIAATDYKRRTKTTQHDFTTGQDELTTGDGQQDISRLNSLVFKTTATYQASPRLSLQTGLDINHEKSDGARIKGSPQINDYALFVSAEIKPTTAIDIRPGLRFTKNSVYDAPPVIPSINTKFRLNRQLDLRLSYGYGFRSPALQELYFDFHDANHDIDGNPDLKAEHSNSFTGSLSWTAPNRGEAKFNSVLSGFYNLYNDQILLAQRDATDPNSPYTYVNVTKSKTAGGTFENNISWRKLTGSLGFSYVGFFSNEFDGEGYAKDGSTKFLWSPEINASIGYYLTRLKTNLNLFYKYTGSQPALTTGGTNTSGQTIVYVGKTSSYNWADFTITSQVHRFVSVTAGIKNIFDITQVNNTAVSSGVHNTNGPAAIGYGRSYFLGLSFQWHKK